MEKRKEVVFGKDSVGDSSKSKEAFIDRSKVRILLCDNDEKSSGTVFTLLCECSYQVTAVRSARQVIDALNAVGPDIDLILAEVDLPMAKGMKMLKYITRDKELRRIPVIMMSAQDEVSVVVKCLRLGAADYLVKPLRTNELLNLWTHMWRRRRMLGLAEKNLISYDFDLVISDPSDANTNSTTLFSDDTDERSRKSTNPETCISTHQEYESNAVAAVNAAIAAAVNAAELPLRRFSEYRPDVPGISDRRTGHFSSSCPKKSELKVGGSSAFFTYVKSSIIKNTPLGISLNDEASPQNSNFKEKHQGWDENQVRITDTTQEQEPGNAEAWENYSQCDEFPSSSSFPDSRSSSNPREFTQQLNPKEDEFCPPHRQRNSKEDEFCLPHQHDISNSREFPHQLNSKDDEFCPPRQHEISNFPPRTFNPYYMPGVMNQVMMPPPSQLYQKNLHAPMMPQYNHLPQVPGMTSFPYFPLNMCIQPGQIPTTHPWNPFQNSNNTETKPNKVDRREAALMKFRQKRKERCFDKKIRYVNRKRLAERRPRVRGQFVRKVNGINVDLNGHPASGDYDEEEDYDDDDDHASKAYSPEDDASGYRCR